MARKAARPGRPKTSALSRREQLRMAKRAHRLREREAGMAEIHLRLPRDEAQRLQVASKAGHFREALRSFLDETVLDLGMWPALKELTWNRAGRWITAEDAFALYERNWRFLDPSRLAADEAALIDRLKHRFGAGVLNA
jgi:hypothetical protein